MRRVSLNARLAQDALGSDEIYVALFEINHPDLEKPIRLSTDNTERLSVEPLYYGTRSTWRGPIRSPILISGSSPRRCYPVTKRISQPPAH